MLRLQALLEDLLAVISTRPMSATSSRLSALYPRTLLGKGGSSSQLAGPGWRSILTLSGLRDVMSPFVAGLPFNIQSF